MATLLDAPSRPDGAIDRLERELNAGWQMIGLATKAASVSSREDDSAALLRAIKGTLELCQSVLRDKADKIPADQRSPRTHRSTHEEWAALDGNAGLISNVLADWSDYGGEHG